MEEVERNEIIRKCTASMEIQFYELPSQKNRSYCDLYDTNLRCVGSVRREEGRNVYKIIKINWFHINAFV